VARRPGTDATLVAYGPSVTAALAAAEAGAERGWDVEVLDLRTIVPLDDVALTESVRRTGRCLVVQEAQGFASVASEIAARVQERCFAALRAPVLRVTGYDIPYPPPLLEDAHLPGPRRILDALERLFATDRAVGRREDRSVLDRQPPRVWRSPMTGRITTDGAVLTGYGPRPADPPLDRLTRRTALPPATRGYERARSVPAVTIWADTDVTGLPSRELLTHFAARCVSGLAEYPELNARIDADRAELVHLPHVHLAFAAQGASSLLTPVIRDAHLLTPEQLAEQLRRLTVLARTGKLPAGQTTGGTFTVNNYGVLNVDGATPLLNHPQSAMLGIGRAIDRPWAVSGSLHVRKIVQLTLTFDHRVCDGVTAAGFLTHVGGGGGLPVLV